MNCRIWILSLLIAAGWVFNAGMTVGQEAADAPGNAPGASSTQDENVIREQTIYIPYEKLNKVFEKQGRGVFLPYEKFQELWNAARKQVKTESPPKRPVQALINSIDNEATIAQQVVNVSAKLQIEILGEGWVTVPLRLRNTAIRSAKIADAPARIIFDKTIGYRLLHQKQGEEPEQIELLIEYTRAFTKTPGQSSVTFEPPQAPINRWRIRVPESGMAVQVEPTIATTIDGVDAAEGEPARSDLLAFVGAAPTVRISWNPKAEGASGLAAFATVQTEQQMTISEGVARTSVKLDYEISRATLTQLVLEVPADQKIVNVFDRNVKRWKFEAAEDKQVVRVDLFEATQGKQSLVVELEKFSDASQSSYEVGAALVRAVGVGRQQGVVVARLESGLQGEAIQRTGLLQLDQNDLPQSLRGAKWGFAYRYGAVPYELVLRVEKVLPRISVTEMIDVDLSTSKLVVNWQGLFLIEEAGLFQLRVEIPNGFEVRSIVGKTIKKSPAVAVDSYHRVSDDATTWLVNLSKKAIGQVGLIVTLERQLSDPNLLSPTGETSTVELPLPRATSADVEFAQGSIVVNAPESLRVNPAATDGLRSVSFAEAYQMIPATPRSSPQLKPALAYSFAKGETAFSVTAERRRPQVTVKQLLRAAVEAGVVKFDVTFFYDVKYSGVKSLRIDVPTSLVSEIRNTSKALRKDEITPKPDDVAAEHTAWSFAAEAEMLGAAEVHLAWEQKIEELGIGKSHEISIPRLIPMNVDRATGQLVISKSESIDIQPTGTPTGLRPIDPQNDVMRQAKTADAAMAFEFVGDWDLTIQATRYELETSKLTSVERGLVRIVALGQDELSVQALFRMRSARQRLAIGLPEGAEFDAQPLRIDGKAVTPERDSATTIFAPLVGQDINKPFVLELRYSVEGNPSQLDLPSFPDDPAVQKVFLCAYLPEKLALLASDGPWADEQDHNEHPVWMGHFSKGDAELLDWITNKNSAALRSAQTFPIGKSRLFVYSTLRPENAPNGSLQLTTADRKLFDGVIVLAIALVGLPLYRRSLRLQLILLLLITATLLVMGVFMPELSRSVFDSVFLIAISLLIVIWLIGHISKLRWSFPQRAPRPAASSFAEAEGGSLSEETEQSDPAASPPDKASASESPPADGSDTDARDGQADDKGGRNDA